MKVNALCLAGAGLGLLSLFLPWWSGHEVGLGTLVDQNYNLVEGVLLDSENLSSAFVVAATLFVVGTGMAFLSPIGGLVQLPGVLGFIALFNQEISTRRGTESFELGLYIALISAIITTVSLLMPLGPGYGFKGRAFWTSLSSANRFRSVGRYDEGARARVNMLALSGAIIAFICIALPWTTISTVPPTTEMTLADRPLFFYLEGSLSSVSAYLFIVGAALSVVTTLGAFVQLGGLFWFWWDFSGSMGINAYRMPGAVTEEAFGIGFYLSVLAILLVAVAIILPLGIGYHRRMKSRLSRLLVWGKAGTLAY